MQSYRSRFHKVRLCLRLRLRTYLRPNRGAARAYHNTVIPLPGIYGCHYAAKPQQDPTKSPAPTRLHLGASVSGTYLTPILFSLLILPSLSLSTTQIH